MSILSAIYGPVPAPPLSGLLSPDAAAEREAPPPAGSDSVTIGGRPGALRPQPAGRALPGNYNSRGMLEQEPGEPSESNAADAADSADQEAPAAAEALSTEGLTDEERSMVAELKARDTEVRAHEAAHLGAGGALARGAAYSYQEGPDGRRYAVGGEVTISTGGGGTPEERVQQAAQVRRAALAPANPSGQDRAVAASATRAEADARADLAQEAREDSAAGPTEAQDGEEAEATDAVATDAAATDAEPTEAAATDAEPTEAEPTEAEPTEAEPTEAEEPKPQP